MRQLPKEYQDQPTGFYTRRVYARGFEGLDPVLIPWAELRKNEKGVDGFAVTKVSFERTVVGFTHRDSAGDQRAIFVKRDLLREVSSRMLAPFRSSKEWREFNLALAFGSRGVWTPKPVYYAESRQDGFPVRFLATMALESSWVGFRKFSKRARAFNREWRSLAQFTRRLHENEMLHADYRADHLFFDNSRIGVWDDLSAWAVIDLDGSRCGGKVSRRERLKALRQLAQSLLGAGLREDDMQLFLNVYDPEGVLKFSAAGIIQYAVARKAARAEEAD
ncbi:hypothetical protein BH09SUM1_BH09SUM1_17010 [soil metagenome]